MSGSRDCLNQSRSYNRFQVYRLKALCERLVRSGHHFEAIDQLKRLLQFLPGDINTLLMLAKSYFDLERFTDCFEATKSLRKEVLQDPKLDIRDLILEAEECKAAKSWINASIFLYCSCSSYSDDLDGILECVDRICDVSWGLMSAQSENPEEVSAEAYGGYFSVLLMMMDDVEVQLKNIIIADGDRHTKVMMRCLGSKADCMISLKQISEATDLSQKCVAELEKRFGHNADKLLSYCEFLFNIAFCSLQADKFNDAVTYCGRAIQAANQCQPATAGERERKAHIISHAENILQAFQNAIKRPTGLGKLFRLFRK